jgi:hypothetical protein
VVLPSKPPFPTVVRTSPMEEPLHIESLVHNQEPSGRETVPRFRTPHGRITMLLAAATFALSAVVTGASRGSAAPRVLTMHLDGTHPVGQDFHLGTFTATPPLCASGAWQGNGEDSRVFTCTDDSGTFTAHFGGTTEHTAGAHADWSITAGTGSYVILRGRGSATIDSSTGDTARPIKFSDTWTGVVDFDATPPAAKFTGVKVTRPHDRGGKWRVRVGFAAHDDVEGNLISYDAIVTCGSFFAHRAATVPGGSHTLSFSFHKGRQTCRFKVKMQFVDPVGNTTAIHYVVKVR